MCGAAAMPVAVVCRMAMMVEPKDQRASPTRRRSSPRPPHTATPQTTPQTLTQIKFRRQPYTIRKALQPVDKVRVLTSHPNAQVSIWDEATTACMRLLGAQLYQRAV
jgi:hypothetical protein